MKALAISDGGPLEHCPDAPTTLPDCLFAAAQQSPARGIVYLHGDGVEHFQSYPTLLHEAKQLLGGLQAAGLKTGAPVIFQFDRNEDFIRALWACFLGGFVPAPTAPALIPAGSTAGRLRGAWQTLGHPVILTTDTMIDSVRECFNPDESTDLRIEAIDGLLKPECEPDTHRNQTDDLALLMLTSGSTGAAKAVRLSHANLLNRTRASVQMNGFSSGDVSLNWMPLDHVAGLTYFHLRDVYLRCRQVHTSTDIVLTNPLKWLDLIEQYKATISFAPNFAYGLINDRAPELSLPRRDLSSMRVLLNGGEPIVAKTARRFLTLLRTHGLSPHAMRPAWGMSETSSGITYADGFNLDASTDEDLFVEVGRPVAGVSLRIVDEQNNLEDAIGSVQVKGLPVTAGYYGALEADPETFTDDGWLRTGDTGFLRHGRLTITGREKDVVIINGANYPSHEIESAVEEIAGVESSYTAAVAVRPQDAQTDKLAVFFHPSSGQHWPLSQLLKDIRRHIVLKFGIDPDYLLPVEKEDFPKTSIGKIHRSHLAQRFQAGEFDHVIGQGDSSDVSLDPEYAAPRTAVEEMLAEVWAEVLKVDRVGIHDNFFALGAHSLLATQVTSRLRRVFQIELPLRRLFESPTVAGLAEVVEEARGKGFEAPPIVAGSSTADAPLSFAQQRLWFLDQLAPGNSDYNVQGALRLTGPLDVAALERSLNEIIRRHETLRMTFPSVDEEPVQRISQSATVAATVVDLTEFSQSERENETRRFADKEAHKPFDLARGPLVRATLLHLAEQDHLLLLNLHHIVCDGWSMGILFGELAALYDAFSSAKPSPLAPLPIQYTDFANWQRHWLQGEVLQTQLSYWKIQLDDAPVLQLHTDYTRPGFQSYRGASQSLVLPKELTDALRLLSRRHGVTLFMTLLAAFQTLLHRYTGQEDIVVGSPVAGRNRVEIESLIGFFVNTLVLRTDLSGNPTFLQLLERVREVALGAYSHQDLPFEKQVEELQPTRELGASPLFQVMFVLQNAPTERQEFGGLTATPVWRDDDTAKFDLTFFIHGEGKELRTSAQYNVELFGPATIVRMLGRFKLLLESIVASPNQSLSDLAFLTPFERHQLLVDWNQTEKDYPKDKSIPELFESQVRKSPDAIALVHNDRQMTYRELNGLANQLAHVLRRSGAGADVIVGICLERSIEMIVGLLGILKAGAAYLPMDPEWPTERLVFMLHDAKAAAVLTTERWLNRLHDSHVNVICVDTELANVTNGIDDNASAGTAANDLAYVIYTSGSTGKPKGVEISHRAVARLLFGVDYAQLDPGQTFMHLAPTSFDASTFEIWGALLHGAKCVLFPDNLPSPEDLGRVLRAHNVTILWLTSSLFNTVIDTAPEILSGVRQLLVGGEALSIQHVRRAVAALPQTSIINGYGPTESTTFACCYSIPPQPDPFARSIPIGRPIANTRIYLLDSHMQPVPIGVSGELYIGGDGLARGYLNQPELTNEKFILNPFTETAGARLYRTGDLARYLPDGNIEFVGRIDNQVKVRGFRIEPGEIESVLTRNPAVKDALVLTHEDASGDNRLLAYVVADPLAGPSASQLRSFLKDKLPEYMIPSGFVFLTAFPRTPNGKVDRKALRPPDQVQTGAENGFVAPRDSVERQLVEIFEGILGLNNIGVKDNFFELGGHSLLAMRVMNTIGKTLDKSLPLVALFHAPTVEQLASLVRDND